MNRAILFGRLGHDPESNYSKGGLIVRFSVATSEKYTGRDRNVHEKTEWHRVVIFEKKLGEVCLKYLAKGAQVLVEGKIQTREYEKDGIKRSVTEIIAARVVFADSKEKDSPEIRY